MPGTYRAVLLAERGWQEPVKILDPTGEIGVGRRPLIAIAKARAAREEDPARLLGVLERLERAYAPERAEDDLVESFVAGLLEGEPDRARRLFALAKSLYRCRVPKRDATADPILG